MPTKSLLFFFFSILNVQVSNNFGWRLNVLALDDKRLVINEIWIDPTVFQSVDHRLFPRGVVLLAKLLVRFRAILQNFPDDL